MTHLCNLLEDMVHLYHGIKQALRKEDQGHGERPGADRQRREPSQSSGGEDLGHVGAFLIMTRLGASDIASIALGCVTLDMTTVLS